jgi:hypothetical protein
MTVPVTLNTPARCIRLAMQDATLLQQGDDPTGEDYAEYMGRLNDMVNLWQTDGLRLWLNQDVAVPLVAGTALYFFGTAGLKPTRVIQAYYEDQNGVRRPLDPMSRDDYVRLSQVSQQGQLNSYFVDKQQSTLNVYFWLTPDATAALGTAHLIRQEQVTQSVSLTDTMNFPVEWFLALRWGLADELSTGMSLDIQQRNSMKAKEYKEKLDNWDVEDADTYFQPDQRMFQNVGRFK